MINNRQQGRRRGRGGPRPLDGRPNNGGGGNRPETRARGNAPQLHEKYKAMARDAQLAGDRVQTEYYLQFADHYYRIINENRPRFDENRPQRDRDDGGRDDGQDQGQSYSADEYEDEDGESGDEEQSAQGRDGTDEGRGPQRARDNGYDREARPQTAARPQRDGRVRDNPAQRDNQPQRDNVSQREPRADRDANGDARPDRPRRDARPDRGEQADQGDKSARDTLSDADPESPEPGRVERPMRTRPVVNGADRPQAAGPSSRAPEDDAPGIDLDRLPPAISRPDVAATDDDEAPRPARRPRRPREASPVED